jgi:transcriptional repressor NrdR
MKCPVCGDLESKVVDSRTSEDGEKIKRRRECLKCKQRFTTFEVLETTPIIVIKKDNTREKFNKSKLLNGFLKACEKRPIALSTLEKAVDSIEKEIRSLGDKEIKASLIGEYAMDSLKFLDKVAYIRFASVYRQFDDLENFARELEAFKVFNKS